MTDKLVLMRVKVRTGASALAPKFERLVAILDELKPSVVAFSGGVDSSLLAYVASAVDARAVCVTASSETYTASELRAAKDFANRHHFVLKVVKTGELQNPKFLANPRDRCYHCKKEMLAELKKLAKGRTVLYGENASDSKDFRPGKRAITEAGARAPLAEAGLSKADIRKLSKALGLETWDMPQNACLASRFEYGMEITKEGLAMVSTAEELLRRSGFSNVRVRLHGRIARIEISDVGKASVKKLASIAKKIKGLGFIYVTLDLEGYRTGSMNEK